jgi:hypothetical protein
MNELNPQVIIDELARRLQQATLENIVLTVQLRDAQAPASNVDEVTVIGDDTQE